MLAKTVLRAAHVLFFMTVLLPGSVSARAQEMAQGPRRKPPDPQTEARITDLLSHMTLEEKIDALGTDPTQVAIRVGGSSDNLPLQTEIRIVP